MNTLYEKKALVLGLGISGRSAAAFLLQRKAYVLGVDQNLNQPEIFPLTTLGLKIAPDTEIPSNLQTFDFLVTSPGISPQHPIVLAAKNAGVEIIGEVELACRALKNRMIGITGTNGKTTVTLLVAHVLNVSGFPAIALGNVGDPLTTELIHDPDPDRIIVAELSSFQLETMHVRCLDAAVVLNITPDHLDRYNDLYDYARAKWLIASCLKAGKPLYVEKSCYKAFGRLLGDHSYWTYGYTPDCAVHTDGERIYFHGKAEAKFPGDWKGKISHDIENIMASYALCREFGVSPDDFMKALKTFKKPSHRIEFVRDIAGVSFYDDSKGTNVDAVIRAVESLPGKIVLIAGGVDKGFPYSHWSKPFKDKVLHICAIGQSAPKIQNDLGSAFQVDLFSTLDDAVKFAASVAKSGDHVLLSPGCSSFDMFKNYAHRGEEFQRIVKDL